MCVCACVGPCALIPDQVTLAVLVCGWAHVLHAVYKPWGTGTDMYMLQHGSLGLTSFVFLMGLLFKVRPPHVLPLAVTSGGTRGLAPPTTALCQECDRTLIPRTASWLFALLCLYWGGGGGNSRPRVEPSVVPG